MLVKKKEFTIAIPNPEYKTFIVHIISLNCRPFVASLSSNLLNADIYTFYRPQISGLIAKKTCTKVSNKYVNFADIFSLDLAFKLPNHTGINDYAIEHVNGQQPLYKFIYSLEPIKLETLKVYIETNLATGFIRLSKSLINIPISFDRNLDSFFQLYIDYQDLNNLTIKNQYLLPLIKNSLDRLKRVKQFTQLDLTSAYHQIRIRKRDE